MTKRFRIGIDVGGTFTHAVAIDAASLALLGKVKVPTTHHSPLGVGQGVVDALKSVMHQCEITPDQIVFIAHSTTQATNSLLEGDVDPVAIVSIGTGWQGYFAKRAGKLGQISLAPGRFLKTFSIHLDATLSSYLLEEQLTGFIKQLKLQNYRSVVVTSPFSVDDPGQENAVAEFLRSHGFLVTATHEVSGLYGLKIRTRTTVINASILPKMLEVTNTTEREIRKLGIAAPLMIMRSDGGVMSVEAMRKKPILTLLSGPAAGIAAALRYLHISDGVFLEVGGTSTDISVIRNGRAVTRSATIGGNQTFLKTLDCRTLGIGGGSLPRIKGKKVLEVGPRSAHIAEVGYAAFQNSSLHDLKICMIQPKKGDSKDYLSFSSDDGQRLTFTPSCAARVLGLAHGGALPKEWTQTFEASQLGSVEEFSEQVLSKTSQTIAKTVLGLLKEYKLDPSWITLIGGGGGALAVVPHLAKTLGMRFEIADDCEVISAIGVALGLIREVVEVSCTQPTSDEIYRVRSLALSKVLSQGADPLTIEVFIEVDQKKNLIRAEAQGSIEFGQSQKENAAKSPEFLRISQRAFGLRTEPELIGRADSAFLSAVLVRSQSRGFLGIGSRSRDYLSVMDQRGVVRLKLKDATFFETTAGLVVPEMRAQLESHTQYDDGGTTYPYIYTLVGDRIIDLSKLSSPEHFTGVLELEVQNIPAHEKAVLIFSRNGIEE